VLDLVDIGDPVIRQVEVLQGSLAIEAFDTPDEVVVQIQPSQGSAFDWQTLDLLDFVEGQDEGLKIQKLFKTLNLLDPIGEQVKIGDLHEVGVPADVDYECFVDVIYLRADGDVRRHRILDGQLS
jgi:hypothetical protein